MTRSTAYDLFISKELDPVACLESMGINEKNKFNPTKLAGVLASFGDFKDQKYRLKIRRDQTIMIQAVRYLLERSPYQSKLGKRRCQENESSAVKRQKKREKLSTQTSCLRAGSHVRGNGETEARVSLSQVNQVVPLDDEVIEAALTLQEMARNYRESRASIKEHIECDQDIITCNAEDKSTAVQHFSQVIDKPTREALVSWYLDTDILHSNLMGMLATIHVDCPQPDEQRFTAYEGRTGRLISVRKTANEVQARVKLFKEGKCRLSSCRESPIDDGNDVRIPARFLIPVRPEKYGEQVIVLCEGLGPCGTKAKVKGIRGTVHTIIVSRKVKEDSASGDSDITEFVDIESENGRLYLPRAHLAKCIS